MSRRRLVIVLPLLLLVALGAALWPLFRAGGGFTPMGQPALPVESSAPDPVFAEWIALGSGCRGRFDQGGDVTMERVSSPPAPSDVYRVRFHLDWFRLTSAGRAPGAPLDFARECAIRVQLGPPAGKRVKRITARTQVVSSKSEAVKLTLLGELRIGPATIGRSVLVHEAGAGHAAREDLFNLASGTKPEEALPPLSCAEKKLVGFDYTWIAQRKAATDEVSVEVSGDQALEIEVDLTDC